MTALSPSSLGVEFMQQMTEWSSTCHTVYAIYILQCDSTGQKAKTTSFVLHLLTLIIVDICVLFLFSFNKGCKEKDISHNLLCEVYFLAIWHLPLNETSIKLLTESNFPSLFIFTSQEFLILCWHLAINGSSTLKKIVLNYICFK